MLMPKEGLTKSKRTGYDVRGWLCKKLSMNEIRAARASFKQNAEIDGLTSVVKKTSANAVGATSAVTGTMSAAWREWTSAAELEEENEKKKELV